MTRVVIDPADLRRVATSLADAAADARLVGVQLAKAELPEMPAGVAALVSSGIAEASTILTR